MKFEHEVIFCIVNAGYSDVVMDAAKEFGARLSTREERQTPMRKSSSELQFSRKKKLL